MYKIGILNDAKNEKIIIDHIGISKCVNGIYEDLDVLRFEISGMINENEVVLSFALNIPDKKLLEIPKDTVIDFKDYIYEKETYFFENDKTEISPDMDILVMRYIKNVFVFNIKFQTDITIKERYAANIEFEFNLDDYMIE